MSNPDREHFGHARYPSEFQKPFERISKKSAYGAVHHSDVTTGTALFRKAIHQYNKGQEREAQETATKAAARFHPTGYRGTQKAYERSIERWHSRPRSRTIFQRIRGLFS